MAENEDDNMTVVPHNQGYDEAADGIVPAPEIERVVDE